MIWHRVRAQEAGATSKRLRSTCWGPGWVQGLDLAAVVSLFGLPAFLCLDFKTSIDNLPEGHLRFELEGNQICRSSGPTERYASRDARFARRAHPSGPLNPGQGSGVDDRDHHLR